MSDAHRWTPNDDRRRFLGYFTGVATGAVAFWPIAFLMWIVLAGQIAFIPSTGHLNLFLITFYAVTLVTWVIIAWTIALPPFLLVRWAARKLSISSLFYYLYSGAVSGALLCGLQEMIAASWRAGDPGPPLWPDQTITIFSYCGGGA